MRCGEVEADAGGFFDVLVAMEFGAVIGSDCFDVVTEGIDERYHAPIESFFGSVLELADDEVAGFAFDQGNDAVLGAVAHDGIDFPVADGVSSLNDRWSLGDVALAGQAAPAVVGTVAFSSLLGGLSQVPVQVAASRFVSPDVLVDGLVADQHDAVKAQMPADLFWAPALAQVAVNDREMGIIELGIAP